MAEKQKVLIVDDDEHIAELISLYLTKECFETQIVGDGEAALDAVKDFNPTLVLLDLMRPGRDGYQVCREIRGTSQVPIIMLSAKGEDDDFILELKKHTNLPIIKAYSNYKYADYALFDNIDPGKGMMFNWDNIKYDKDFFLAGGIDINNISEALKLNPYAIDISSSVETNGFKDEEKIKEIIRKVRS